MTEAAKHTLKPCPFCGDAPYLTNGGPGNHYVKCDGCRASSDDGSPEYAVEHWNRRAFEAQERLIETLTEALETTLGKWVDLVESGDAGFWDAETEPHVIAARTALAQARKG